MQEDHDAKIQELFADAAQPRTTNFADRVASALVRQRRRGLAARAFIWVIVSAALFFVAPAIATVALWIADAVASSTDDIAVTLAIALCLAILAIGAQRALRRML